MKIQNGNKPDLLDSLVKTAQVKPQQQKDLSVEQRKGQGASYDKVELSSRKQEVDRLTEKAKTQSVVREEKVEELRARIEDLDVQCPRPDSCWQHTEIQYPGRAALMMTDAIIEMTKREEKTLKEFLTALQMERDAIISFSLDGIIAGNNKKEEILRKLEYLKAEKEKLLEGVRGTGRPSPTRQCGPSTDSWPW